MTIKKDSKQTWFEKQDALVWPARNSIASRRSRHRIARLHEPVIFLDQLAKSLVSNQAKDVLQARPRTGGSDLDVQRANICPSFHEPGSEEVSAVLESRHQSMSAQAKATGDAVMIRGVQLARLLIG